jgi:inner membrane protein
MMAGSHVALGVAAWLGLAPYLGHADVSPLPLGLAVVGSLLPDIDHPKSWAGKRMRPLSTAWARVLGHRGVTHSVFAVAVCCWLLLRHGLPAALAAPLAVGYLSHLGADLLTPGGLRLAWPFRGTWSLPLCRTGSPFEPLVVAVVLAWAWCGASGTAKIEAGLREAGFCRLGIAVTAVCPAPGTRARMIQLSHANHLS